jgi:hypothetical protein
LALLEISPQRTRRTQRVSWTEAAREQGTGNWQLATGNFQSGDLNRQEARKPVGRCQIFLGAEAARGEIAEGIPVNLVSSDAKKIWHFGFLASWRFKTLASSEPKEFLGSAFSAVNF